MFFLSQARQREVETLFGFSEDCILGNVIEVIENVTRQECGRACVAYGLGMCAGFEFLENGATPNYEPHGCHLLSSTFRNGCNNMYYNRVLFEILPELHPDDPFVSVEDTSAILFLRFAQPQSSQAFYTRTGFDYELACSSGESLEIYYELNQAECRRKCVEYGLGCRGVEYHLSVSNFRMCVLKDQGPNVECEHVEFFEKEDFLAVPTIAPTMIPEPTISPSLSPTTPAPTDPLTLQLVNNLDPLNGLSYDRFGSTVGVDIENKYIIVGSPEADTKGLVDSGAANIYGLDEDGLSWDHLIRLQPSDLVENSTFGTAVAISNVTAVVSSHVVGNGTVYIYGRINDDKGLWVQQAILREPGEAGISGHYGVSVDLAGDTLLVGADHYDSTGPNCGAVFVYKRKYYSWFKVQTLVPANCTSDDYFGRSVKFDSESDDQFIVGSVGDSTHGESSGSAYVYEYDPTTTTWYLGAQIFATDSQPGDSFGVSVALNRNRAIVGAYKDNTDYGGISVGSVYIFQKINATAWVEDAKLENSDGMGDDGFGTQVAIYRDVVIAGSPGDDISDIDRDTRGSVYIFSRVVISGDWEEVKKVSGANANANLGACVSIYDKTVIFGAPGENVAGAEERGQVYVYEMVCSPSCLFVVCDSRFELVGLTCHLVSSVWARHIPAHWFAFHQPHTPT